MMQLLCQQNGWHLRPGAHSHARQLRPCASIGAGAPQPHQHASSSRAPVRRRRAAVLTHASDDQALAQLSRLSERSALDAAARRFQQGLDDGLDEDWLAAREMGVRDMTSMNDLQSQYKDKVKAQLQKRAQELKKEDEALRTRLSKNLQLGKEAYGCGEYAAAVKLLLQAVEELDSNSILGGEAQLWLALAYQACGREQDCINVYKSIEANHPVKKIRKQAADLRYIVEAPKLEISEEERVKIPLITSDTWRKESRKTGYSSRLPAPAAKKKTKGSYWDSASWSMPPASFIPDKWYVRVAWVCVLAVLTVYANFQLTSPPQ